jgi:hypothetical protein
MMHRGRVKDDDVVGRINQRYVGDPTRKILIVVKKLNSLPNVLPPYPPERKHSRGRLHTRKGKEVGRLTKVKMGMGKGTLLIVPDFGREVIPDVALAEVV